MWDKPRHKPAYMSETTVHVVLTLTLKPDVAQWLHDFCAGKYPEKFFTSDPAEAVSAFVASAAQEDLWHAWRQRRGAVTGAAAGGATADGPPGCG